MTSSSEQLSQSLEVKLEKLQKTLKYWQTWEAEYEACKEEIGELGNDATAEEMVEIGIDYDGHAVNEEEIKSIVNYGKTPTRTKAQVLGILSGRAETGRKNVEVVQKQLEKVEDELSEAISSGAPNVGNEPGRRMMEITEELDDHDNIISSNVSDFNQEMDQIQKALKKLPQSSSIQDKSTKVTSEPATTKSATKSPTESSRQTLDAEESLSQKLQKPDGSEIERHSLKSLVNDQSSYAEAYDSLNELNPIVATMDIEEYSDSDDNMETDENDSENEYGMNNINDEISEDYIREMEALIQKHAITNIGGGTAQNKLSLTGKSSTPAKSVLRNVPMQDIQSSKPVKAKEKKGVKFAESLDVAPGVVESNRNVDLNTEEPEKPAVAPMADLIVERKSSAVTESQNTAEKPKISRFKASKMGHSTPVTPSVETSSTNTNWDELSFKDELKLYKERMEKPEQQLDRQLFQDEDQQPKTSERLSKFKAARLGIRQDDD